WPASSMPTIGGCGNFVTRQNKQPSPIDFATFGSSVPIMGAIRQQRTLIAWIAMLALLGNVVAGMFCSPPLKRAGAAGYPTELLGALVICSEHGEQTLPDDGGA